MGIFDNAKSILIGDKEVKSISVDGGVIYDSSDDEIVLEFLTINDEVGGVLTGVSITLVSDKSSYSGVTDNEGKCSFTIKKDDYDVTFSKEGFQTVSIPTTTYDESKSIVEGLRYPNVTTQ